MHHEARVVNCPGCEQGLRVLTTHTEHPVYTDGADGAGPSIRRCIACRRLFSPERLPTSPAFDAGALPCAEFVSDELTHTEDCGVELDTEVSLRIASWRCSNRPLRAPHETVGIVVLGLIAATYGFLAVRLTELRSPELAVFEGAFGVLFGGVALALIWHEVDTQFERWKQRRRYFAPREAAVTQTYRSTAKAARGDFRANLEKLQTMLDERDRTERLLAAEIARQLGAFDEAICLTSGDSGAWAKAIRREARAGRRFVART